MAIMKTLRLLMFFILSFLLSAVMLISTLAKAMEIDAAMDLVCANVLKAQTQVVSGNNEIFLEEPTFFLYTDPENKFIFEAILVNDTLHVEARLVNKSKNVRSRLRGEELFDRAVSVFGLENIKQIEGSWYYGNNYEEYYQNSKAGMEQHQAALNTWTGRLAQKYGFTTVSKLRHDVAQDKSGKMNKSKPGIIVTFSRP